MTAAQRIHDFLRARVYHPLLRLLHTGVSPQVLSWSFAVGLMVGVSPTLGVTTVIMLLLAWLLRLNYVATQIGIHVMTPLQVVLFLPLIDAGIVVFRAERLPMSRAQVLSLMHHHPIELMHVLWRWEWHALVVWAVFAVVLTPFLAAQIRKVLEASMRRHQHLLA